MVPIPEFMELLRQRPRRPLARCSGVDHRHLLRIFQRNPRSAAGRGSLRLDTLERLVRAYGGEILVVLPPRRGSGADAILSRDKILGLS